MKMAGMIWERNMGGKDEYEYVKLQEFIGSAHFVTFIIAKTGRDFGLRYVGESRQIYFVTSKALQQWRFLLLI